MTDYADLEPVDSAEGTLVLDATGETLYVRLYPLTADDFRVGDLEITYGTAPTTGGGSSPGIGSSGSALFDVEETIVTADPPAGDEPPPTGVQDAARWLLEDPFDASTYSLPINPTKASTPMPSKAITGETNVQGNYLAWQGSAKPAQWSVQGTLLDAQAVSDLSDWAFRPRRIYLTDHLARRYEVRILGFRPQPLRVASNPGAHTYTLTLVVYRGPL